MLKMALDGSRSPSGHVMFGKKDPMRSMHGTLFYHYFVYIYHKNYTPRETHMTMENQPFEDVSPIR